MQKKIKKIAASVLSIALLLNGNNVLAATSGAASTEPLENIMKGLSTFKFREFTWPESLTVGGTAFSIAESLYEIRIVDEEKSESLFWDDEEMEEEMKDFYSNTDWGKFTGMYETVEVSNFCDAELTDEVAKYESLMEDAAKEYGFTQYQELFKAIAQARFNTNEEDYQIAKKKGRIHGTGDDLFDLFAIDGSWIDGEEGKTILTPVGKAKAPSPKPSPTPVVIPRETESESEGIDYVFGDDDIEIIVPTSTQTPKPTATVTPTPPPSEPEREKKVSNYTVSQSIDLAAKAFVSIVDDAVYPSPYDTNKLICIAQGFEFGGNSGKIRARFEAVDKKLDDTDGFRTFTEYCCSKEWQAGDDPDYDGYIENYAAVVADEKTRSNTENGKYKYSDQKFYEKVFQVYKTVGGGTIDYGNLPESMKEILRECMKGWDSRVTKERREIIQQGIMLYGVTYSQDYGRSNIDHPQYLDCSSFTGQSYWRAGLLGREAAYYTTASFCDGAHGFSRLSGIDQLIPGDVGLNAWTLATGNANHVGIYVGQANGARYWLHCTSGGGEKGVRISRHDNFTVYGRLNTLS